MSEVVIDASLALAWCFPDEASDYADGVLVAVESHELVVPAIWPIEIMDGLLVGERRKRIRQPEIRRFIELLNGLTIVEDLQRVAHAAADVLSLARENDLSAYDAAYLDVAVRRGAPLATLDGPLQKAARATGVQIFKI